MNKMLLALVLPLQLFAQQFSRQEIGHWQQQAKQVNIIRDNWGIPHIYGKTDADAVFGLLYAQCEDDFNRVEMNYIEKLGRMAEVKGKTYLYSDLLIRLIIDSSDAKADYEKAAPWLKKLLVAWAGGINYYMYKHPELKPALLHRFEPWFPLLWTDGSIGAISTGGLTEKDLAGMYPSEPVTAEMKKDGGFIMEEEKPLGSNGFAFSPKITASGNAILYINPHVTFYFRPEVHMVSEEGLNVYGAVTWGQFFVYQGFNEHCGWMHTSSAVDVSDLYAEKVSKKDGHWVYEYDKALRPVTEKPVTIFYKDNNKTAAEKFTTYYTHHGPVMAQRQGTWISVRSHNRSITGLIQSWQRNKTKSFAEYKNVMGLLANTSNNTVYADAEGNIAYWHGNFIPVRDTAYDWSRPVDGSIRATEWKGLHSIDESVHLYNPPNGWLQNCNSTPFTVAGIYSPKKEQYPRYMAPDGENFRGLNAVRVLKNEKAYTLDKVIAAGYDNYLSAFEKLVPALIRAYAASVKDSGSYYYKLAEPISVLKNWDYRCNTSSIATSLAVEWGQLLIPMINNKNPDDEFEFIDQVTRTEQFIARVQYNELLQPLLTAINRLNEKWGTWKVPWGDINRYQRISSDIDQKYDDSQPSIPVGFASSTWGMLPSYSAAYFPGTKKRYGVNGNSFICAVEFGKKIKARSLLAGGESGDPRSRHFNDQMDMYSKGQFKEVLFYKEDVLKHAERSYHPGE